MTHQMSKQLETEKVPLDLKIKNVDQINVLVITDNKLCQEMMCRILSQEMEFHVERREGKIFNSLDYIKKIMPHIVLLCSCSTKKDSHNIISLITQINVTTKVIVLSQTLDEDLIFSALKAGAKGFLTSEDGIQELIKAIKAIHNGELWVERSLIARFFERKNVPHAGNDDKDGEPKEALTPREMEVLRILSTGCTNKEIAKILFISEKTVKSHLNSIFKKINVTRRIKAILYAVNEGLYK